MTDDTLGMGLTITLKDSFSANARAIARNTTALDANIAQAARRISFATRQMEGGLKMFGAGAAALAIPTAFIASTVQTQKALGALSAEGVVDLEALENAAAKFTNTWAGVGKSQFLDSAWAVKGALSQLSDEALGTATAMVALTAKATRGDLTQMTEAMTLGYNVFRGMKREMSDQAWMEGFSGALTETVNKFRTDGNMMSVAIRNLGSTGSALGVSLEEQLATLGTLQGSKAGEQAGTYYKAFLDNVLVGGRKLGVSVAD